MKHYTGFNSFEKFEAVLYFVVPYGGRSHIIGKPSQGRKGVLIQQFCMILILVHKVRMIQTMVIMFH